jgi:hypothetical protein
MRRVCFPRKVWRTNRRDHDPFNAARASSISRTPSAARHSGSSLG